MVDVLLVHKKCRHGCFLAGIFNNPDMVDVLPVHKKKIRNGYYPTSIFKIKEKGSQDIVAATKRFFIKT